MDSMFVDGLKLSRLKSEVWPNNFLATTTKRAFNFRQLLRDPSLTPPQQWKLNSTLSYTWEILSLSPHHVQDTQGDQGRPATSRPEFSCEHPHPFSRRRRTATKQILDTTPRRNRWTCRKGRGLIFESILSDPGLRLLPPAQILPTGVSMEGGG